MHARGLPAAFYVLLLERQIEVSASFLLDSVTEPYNLCGWLLAGRERLVKFDVDFEASGDSMTPSEWGRIATVNRWDERAVADYLANRADPKVRSSLNPVRVALLLNNAS